MSKETKRGIALQGAAGALGRKRLPRAGLGVFNRPSLPPPPCPVQVTRHSACHTGCSTSRLCRSTSCCAASAQLGGCWTSQESEYRNGCLGEGGNAPPGLSAQRVPPILPQVTGLLPHLLLPERVGHCPALWQWRSAPRVGPGHPRKPPGRLGGGGRRSGTPTSGLFQAQSALSFTLAAAHASSLQHCAGKSGEGGDALLAAACAQPGGCRVGV